MAAKKAKPKKGLSVSKGVNGKPGGTMTAGYDTKRKPWKPYDPYAKPPSGSYDPAIDAEDDASKRGYGYTQEDVATANARAGEDLAIGRDNIAATRGIRIADTNTSYKNLGFSQTMSQRAGNTDLGGVGQLSRNTRQANQTADLGRIYDEYGNPATGDYGRQGKDLDLGYTRGISDRGDTLTRALTERTAYKQAAQASRVSQAQQSVNYKAPVKPKNEFTLDATGQKYKLRKTRSGSYVKVLPSGRIVKRSDTTSME